MNMREQDTIRAPSGKDDVCAVFIIDTVDEPFVLQGVAEPDTQYTLSFYAKSDVSGKITISDTTMATGTDWQRYVITFIADSEDVEIYFGSIGTYYLYNTQLEIGCKDTDFALNPADTEIGLSDLTVVVNNHSTQFSVMDGQISALIAEDATIRGEYDTLVSRTTSIEADLTGITNRVTLAETDLSDVGVRMTTAESALIQQAELISLKVSTDEVIAAINLTSEEAKISAAKITLEGATIADNFTATNLHITGNSVFDGTLNGATGTFAGSLSAASGTFTGALSGATGSFSGSVTAASGKIGNWFINNSRITTSKTIYMGAKEAGMLLVNEADRPCIFVQDANGNEKFSVSRDGLLTANNAKITGDITATSIKLSETVQIYHPTSATYRTLINQASDNINIALAYSSVTIPNVVSTGSVWAQGTTYGGQFNAVYNDRGVMLRNDGSHFCILLSDQGDATTWNSLRPFSINLTSGDVSIQTPFYFTPYGMTSTRRPLGSSNEEGAKCSVIKSKISSSGSYYFTLAGQWGTSDGNYVTKQFHASTSDVRLKANIADTDITALPIISQMQIRQFDWRENGIHQKIGFVADELELLDPALAIGGGYDEDGNIDAKSVNEFYLTGYLTKGIQELYLAQLSQADELLTHKSQIDYLLDENAALKKRVKELEKQIA